MKINDSRGYIQSPEVVKHLDSIQKVTRQSQSKSINSSLSENRFDRISIQEAKATRSFDSYKQMIDTIRSQIKKIELSKALSSNPESISIKAKKANVTTLSQAILSTCDVAVKRVSEYENILFINDPTSGLMTSHTGFFEKLITDISSDQVDESSVIIDDISRITRDVMVKMKNDSTVRDIVDINQNYIVMNNGITFDVENRKILLTKDVATQYDILNKNSSNFIFNQIQSQEEQQTSLVHRNIISRVMKDWSQNDEDVEYLLWQMMFSVLIGQNCDKFVIIKGSGGNGKSTFMSLLGIIAGQSATVNANIHQFGDPNAINRIHMGTKVILGDDAATNHKISDVALSNLKSIVTGDPISVPVKFAANTIVQTDALFVQGTNTDLSFYENNPAIKSRLVVINWTNTDFRSNKPVDVTFNLDELMKNQAFIDEWVSMCIEKVEKFNKFVIPKSVIEATNEMVESNDTIKQFLDDVIDLINGFEKIPIKGMYAAYEKWLKENNPNGGKLKLQTFTKSLHSHHQEFSFKMSNRNDRIRFKTSHQIKAFSHSLNVHDFNLDKQAYIIMNNPITKKELDNFDSDNFKTFEDLSDRERQIVYILAYEQNRTDIISKFGQDIS